MILHKRLKTCAPALLGLLLATLTAIPAAGLDVHFHSDGQIIQIIPDLLEAGIDALNPIEITAGMDLEQVKALYGDQLVIINVEIPKSLTSDQWDLIEKLGKSLGTEVKPQERGFFDRLKEVVGG